MRRAELYDQIRFDVQGGVATPKRIFDRISWSLSSVEDPSDNLDQKARGLAAKLLRERDALERTWTDRGVNTNQRGGRTGAATGPTSARGS